MIIKVIFHGLNLLLFYYVLLFLAEIKVIFYSYHISLFNCRRIRHPQVDFSKLKWIQDPGCATEMKIRTQESSDKKPLNVFSA